MSNLDPSVIAPAHDRFRTRSLRNTRCRMGLAGAE